MADANIEATVIEAIHKLEAAGDKLAPQAADAAYSGIQIHGIVSLGVAALGVLAALIAARVWWRLLRAWASDKEDIFPDHPEVVGLLVPGALIGVLLVVQLTELFSVDHWMEAINPIGAIAYHLIAKL